ncbi:MAG: ferrochelatase [Gemmatimonadota bacterium]
MVVINFGEPEGDPGNPGRVSVAAAEAYLKRIFLQNVDLEQHENEAAVRRAEHLARMRAPGLVEDYALIGGSPLNRQSDEQARTLERELRGRSWDVKAYSAFQFTPPFISDAVRSAKEDGVEILVALPVYPLCGASTTVAALRSIRETLEAEAWSPRFMGMGGWHHHPGYRSARVDHIRGYLERQGLDLNDPDTLLYFSVHGTPLKYLNEGNRYDRYVEEHCRDIARGLGAERYGVGFQNHTNRKIEWTQPDNEDLIPTLQERRLVVVPISFMHEQSETLAELDHEVRTLVEGLGKEFYRVPVPFDDPRFARFLADLVAQLVAAGAGDHTGLLTPCRCDPHATTWCTNGARDLPPSPYAP